MFHFILAAGLIAGIQEGSERPKVVEVIPKKVYTPQNFDDNDTAQFIVEGEFPSKCYRLKEVKVYPVKDDNNVYFRVFANEYPGPCKQEVTSYYWASDVDILEEGNYSIWDVTNRENMGTLKVHHTESTKRDDFDYAPVDSAVVFYDSNSQRSILTLFGTKKNSCSKIDPDKFWIHQTGKDLIEILPILMTEERDDCKEGDFQFRQNFTIPENIKAGRYLFHIRTADGQSFNKIDIIKGEASDSTVE